MSHRKNWVSGLCAMAAVLLAGTTLGAVAPVAGAQASGQAQQPAPKAAPPAQEPLQAPPAEKPPITKEEEDALNALDALPQSDVAQIISQGEAFLTKFPTSSFRSRVYARLEGAYLNAGQVDKLFDMGTKAISEDPDNVDVLAILAMEIPRKVDTRALDAQQRLGTAEKYANRAIELANTMAKPKGATDEAFTHAKNEKLGMAHTGLGLVYYMRGQTAKSVEEFDQAVKTDPSPDPLAFFLLGDGQSRLKRYAEAADAFNRCAQLKWSWQDRCKAKAEDMRKQAAANPTPSAPPAAPAAKP